MLNLIVFTVFVVTVIGLGIWKGKSDAAAEGESTDGAKDYFLAGGKLTWYLVGFSLIAANISTEQFVGMSGKSADWLGMAIASYEWMAAITLVGVAFIFLPTFLRAGIYTIPEFLEKRYSPIARTVMAVFTMVVLVLVPTASVIFSGGKVVSVFFAGTPILGDLAPACYLIAALAAVYVFIGGLKACAWTDLVWGSALIIGGAVVMWLAFAELGSRPADELIQTATATSEVTVQELEEASGFERLSLLNAGPATEGPNGSGGKLHMIRPNTDSDIPWSALLVGLWIPNFFYWGLNQYIMQRSLGSKSLAEGQRGIVFAAFLKLLIPFVVVIPGIMAYNLFHENLRSWAMDKNADAVALVAPSLYESLSDDFRVDPSDDDARIQQVYDRVTKRLETAKADGADDQLSVIEFAPDFAELLPSDAALILAHNTQTLAKAQGELVVPTGSVHETNVAVVQAAKASGASINSQTLSTRDYDAAFPVLLAELLKEKPILPGLVLAAIFGAVVSSLASMLNSASTVATMDLVNEGSKLIKKKPLNDKQLVSFGRFFVVLFVLIAAGLAPLLENPTLGGIFTFIQEFQGFISPGILAIFLFGLLVKKAPRICGVVGLVLNPILYGFLKWTPATADIAFLNRMAICFGVILLVLAILTLVKPLKEPIVFKANPDMDMTPSPFAKTAGIVVVVLTLILYGIFW